MKLRRQIFEIIQPAEKGNALSKIFDLIITMLVLTGVVCIFVVTFDLPNEYIRILKRYEIFVSVVFSVEYILRILTADLLYPGRTKVRAVFAYVTSGMAIIDLLAILPLYLPMIFPGNFLVIRIFRLLRLLRVFKLNRYFESLAAIGTVIKSKTRELLGSMFFVGLMLIVSSLIIYTVEHEAQPEVFKNAFSGLWWAVATLTTVGYGDLYPVTGLGRVFGAVIALLGIGMVAIPTGIISSGLIEHMNKEKRGKLSGEDHSYEYCPHCGKKLK